MNMINICKMNGKFIDCMIGPGQNGILTTTYCHSSIAPGLSKFIWSSKVSKICLSVTIFLLKQCLFQFVSACFSILKSVLISWITEWFGSKSCPRNFYDKNMDVEAHISLSSNSAHKKFFHILFVLISHLYM